MPTADGVITDDALGDEAAAALRDAGVDLRLATR